MERLEMMNLIIADQQSGKSIVVQTHRGTNVTNCQCSQLSESEKHTAKTIHTKYSGIRCRSGPSPMYNCHGLTFASRRTRVWHSAEVWKILREDDYVEMELENVKPGDIVMYNQNGDLQHSGVVQDVPRVGSRIVPMILSKWGSGQEFIHSVYNCPYVTAANIKYYRILGVDDEH